MSQNLVFQSLKNYQLLRVSGTDSHKFLQGQLTCDLDQVDGSRAVIGGYCNVQGRLHATFYILKAQEDYLLLLPIGVAEHLQETLAKYAVFFQTELSVDEQHQALAFVDPDQQHLAQTDLNSGTCFTLGQLSIVILPNDETETFIAEKLSDYQSTSTDLMALEQIKLGIAMVETETIEQLLPHYIGFPQIGGVNFEKGCYTGQEVVARMHYRGTLKTHAHQAIIDTIDVIKAGSEIHNSDGKKVGELINAARDGEKLIAIISLADKALEQGLHCEGHLLTLLN